jgi:hypothetical protein
VGWNNPFVLARVVVAVIAVAAIGWLAVMERDARLYERGIAAGGSLDDPATIARAESDLERARLLNPDRTADIGRSLVLWVVGRGPEARALLEDVVRSEPDNLSAWTVLSWVNDGADAALERRVRAQVRRLDPLSEERRPAPPLTAP